MRNGFGWLFPAYYAVGLALALRMYIGMERKPADRLGVLARLGARACLISQTAMLWPLCLLAWGFEIWRARRTEIGAAPVSVQQAVEFQSDDTGVIRLGTRPQSEEGLAVFFALVVIAMTAGCWIQERRLTGLFIFSSVFCMAVLLFLNLFVRHVRLERDGLYVKGAEIYWTEAETWRPRHFCIPLQDIAGVTRIETDPLFFERGIALILKDELCYSGNCSPGLSQQELDRHAEIEGIPPHRLVVWPHDRWNWEPEQVAACLRRRIG